MATFVFINNFRTTLASAINTTATSITLASSSGLPALSGGEQMPLTLNDAATGTIYEIVYVTAIVGATLTVIRAQEGTTAQNWAIGDYASCNPTAGTNPVSSVFKNGPLFSVSANTTLTAANAGLVLASGTITLTLASGSTMSGGVFNIVNAGTGIITITAGGTDTIGPSSLASVTLSQSGQSVELYSNGGSPANWVRVGGAYDVTNISYSGATNSFSAGGAFNSIFPTKSVDILSEYNTSTGTFTPKESGFYSLFLSVGFSTSQSAFYSSISTISATTGSLIGSYSASTLYTVTTTLNSIYLTHGTTYYIVCQGNVSGALSGSYGFGSNNYLIIKRIG